MATPNASPALARLRQLQGFLARDPANPHLLADVCDAALAAGERETALQAIEAAQLHKLDAPAWLHRRAHVAMCAGAWDDALADLEQLQSSHGQQAALAHDVAWVHLCRGAFDRCRAEIEPWLTGTGLEPSLLARLQALWLRAMHQLGQLPQARDWVQQQQARGRLQPHVAGVASLIAIDLEDFPAAEGLANAALGEADAPVEAFVAGAYVALARKNTTEAVRLLRQALQTSPDDGRTWSAMGMASLQSGDLAAAREHFERAVRTVPGHIGTWHGLAWACLAQPDLAAARSAFSRALELDRNFAESHAGVALVLWAQGDKAVAEHHLRIAERLDPRSVTAGYVRALATGQLTDAKAVHQLAQRLLDRPGFFGGRLADSLPE